MRLTAAGGGGDESSRQHRWMVDIVRRQTYMVDHRPATAEHTNMVGLFTSKEQVFFFFALLVCVYVCLTDANVVVVGVVGWHARCRDFFLSSAW